MASRRRISRGKSYGRAQAIISYALEVWEEFGSWCLIHGIEDPWKLPSYRFGALVVFYLREDKVEEGLSIIEEALSEADDRIYPFFDPVFRRTAKAMCRALTPTRKPPRTTVDNVVYDPRLVEIDDDLPIEERKKKEAEAKGKAFRVPDWWRGEKANYKIAQSMMVALPKKMGPVKE